MVKIKRHSRLHYRRFKASEFQRLCKLPAQHATAIIVEALKQLGLMLKAAPKNKGAKGINPITGTKRVPVMDDTLQR